MVKWKRQNRQECGLCGLCGPDLDHGPYVVHAFFNTSLFTGQRFKRNAAKFLYQTYLLNWNLKTDRLNSTHAEIFIKTKVSKMQSTITVSVGWYLCVVTASNTDKIIVVESWNEKWKYGFVVFWHRIVLKEFKRWKAEQGSLNFSYLNFCDTQD